MRLLPPVLLIFLAALPTAARQPGGLARDDPRLAKRVTLRLKRTPLSDVVAELRRQTGVTLATAAPVADEPAIVYLADLPAAEVMRHLAEHFDYRWRRTGSAPRYRYELYQDRESARREEERRQLDRQRALESLQRQLRVMPVFAGGNEPLGYRALMELSASLQPGQWAALHRDQTLRFSTRPSAGELPLPAALADGFLPALQPRPGRAGTDELLERGLGEQAALLSGRDGLRLDLWLDFPGLWSLETLVRLQAMPVLLLAEKDLPADASARVIGFGMHRYPRPHAPDPEAAAAAWGDDPVLGRRRSFEVDPARVVPAASQRAGRRAARLHEILPEVAAVYDLQLIADAYGSQQLPPAPPLVGSEMALHAALNRFVSPVAEWRKEGEVVRVRSRTWHFDRLAEIPDQVLQQWTARLARERRLTFQEAVRLAAVFNDQQFLRLPHELEQRDLRLGNLGLDPLAGSEAGHRAILRSFAHMTATHQARLLAGRATGAREVGGQAREWFAAALRHAQRTRPTAPPPSADLDGTLSLTVLNAAVEILGEEADGTRYRLRALDGPEPGSELGQGTARPGLLPPGQAEGKQTIQRFQFSYKEGEQQIADFRVALPWAFLRPEASGSRQ